MMTVVQYFQFRTNDKRNRSKSVEHIENIRANLLLGERRLMKQMKIPTIIPAPELVLENASDSDSSRRVSQLSQLTDYSPSISSSSSASKLKSNPWLSIPCESSIPRRASHAGEYLSPEAHISGSHLDVPVIRERNSSLPSTVLTEELYIMRNFTTNGRKVLNQGDSVRSRRGSRTSISSRGSR